MEKDGAPDVHQFGSAAGAAARLVALAARVGADPLESSDAALQRRLLVLMSVGTLPMTVFWSAIYFAAGAPLAASAPAVYSIITPINTALLGWTRNFRLYRFVQLLMTLVLPWIVMMSLGGFKESSAVIIWAALCPVVSLLVEDLRRTWLWIAGFVLLLIVSAILQPYLARSGLPEAFVTWFFVLNLGSVIAIVFALLSYFVGQRNFFQERSETLLLNILPKEISEALKSDRSAIAAHYESASVLFADVVGFTPMAATMTPLRLVNLLNDVFHCFDDLVEKHDLEKIKTIGDCYMAVAGLDGDGPGGARALGRLALAMLEANNSRPPLGGQRMRLRVGLHCGPATAGVIGDTRFSYDVWGDAVNVAARMESHGVPDRIHVSEAFRAMTGETFVFEERGPTDIKSIGVARTFFLTAPD